MNYVRGNLILYPYFTGVDHDDEVAPEVAEFIRTDQTGIKMPPWDSSLRARATRSSRCGDLNSDRTLVSAYETELHTEWDASTTATKPVDVSPIRDLFIGHVDHIVTDDAQSDQRSFQGRLLQADFRGRPA
jgi:hypothetical protein